MKRLRLCLTFTLALLMVAVPFAGAAGNPNPGILPPDARVQGLTLGEWNAAMFQEIFAIPLAENPLAGHYGSECYYARRGNVGFFDVGNGQLDITCEVPAGVMLLVGVGGVECSTLEPPPWHGENEEELRSCAQSYVPSDLQASIDGVAVQNLRDYLVTSPLFDFTVPDDNILGLPAGSGQSVAYADAFMLAPLPPGQHTIHLADAYPPEIGIWWDATFHVTVTP